MEAENELDTLLTRVSNDEIKTQLLAVQAELANYDFVSAGKLLLACIDHAENTTNESLEPESA